MSVFLQKIADMRFVRIVCFSLLLLSCRGTAQHDKKDTPKTYPVQKTDAEWQAQLNPMAYQVLRKAATERAYSGEYYKNKELGIYVCAGCKAQLYASKHKYDSGSGWPSFDRGNDENLEYDVDYKLGYGRTELKCAQCGGHLGHIFDDGPRETTGKRHCINSVALEFIPY